MPCIDELFYHRSGATAYQPYWGQTMAYYVPQNIPTGSTVLSPPPGSVSTSISNNQVLSTQPPQTPTARVQNTPPYLPPAQAANGPTNGYIATFIQSPTTEPKNAIITVPPGSNVFQYPTPPLQLAPQCNSTATAVPPHPPTQPVPNSHYASTPPATSNESLGSGSNHSHKQTGHRPNLNINNGKNQQGPGLNAVQSVSISSHQNIKNGPIFRTPNIISNGIPPPINVIHNAAPPDAPFTSSAPNNNITYNDRRKIPHQPIINRKVPNGSVRPGTYNPYVNAQQGPQPAQPPQPPPPQPQPQPPPPPTSSSMAYNTYGTKNMQKHPDTGALNSGPTTGPGILPSQNPSNSNACTNGPYGEANNSISDKRSVINSVSHANASANKNKTSGPTISHHNAGPPDRPRGPRPKVASLDIRRSVNSNRNTPSTNSTESNNSPNSIISLEPQPLYHMSRAQHLQTAAMANSLDGCQSLACNPATGMYVKLGQAYFSHVSAKCFLLIVM